MQLTVSHDFLPKSATSHAAVVMDHFGINFEAGQHLIAQNFELPLLPAQVVCFTGPSGSGKSSLMRAAAAQLEDVLDIDRLALDDRLLIDAIERPPGEAMSLLAACGLGEARLLLRTPAELSDGQRYRFRLALALSKNPRWIVADEFTATLDRTLAKVVAFNISRLASRTGIGFLLATTHEDILNDLAPHHHVRCDLDALPTLRSHLLPFRPQPEGLGDPPPAQKKRRSPSPTASNSPPARVPTGRTSLGGITAPIISESSAG